MTTKKVIAAAFHPGSAYSLVPVIKRLNDDGLVNVLTLGMGGERHAEGVFSSCGIDFKTIDYFGVSDASASSMEKILSKEKPSLIIVGSSSQDKDTKDIIEQTLTQAAQSNNIKTLAVLSSYIHHDRIFSDIYDENGVYNPNYSGGRFKFLTDRIAVMDSFTLEEMLQEGFDGQMLVVTGNPHNDRMYELKTSFVKEDKNNVRDNLNLDRDAFVFMFASQPIEQRRGMQYGYTQKTSLRELLDSLNTFKSHPLNVLVKAHPSEDPAGLEATTKYYDFKTIVDKKYDTFLSILACDIVVSAFSTALIEACYLGKPSISLQPGLNQEDPLTFNKLGITEVVYKKGKLVKIIRKILSSPDNYLKEFEKKANILYNDGRATERVVDLVYNLI